jgi:ribonuclease Z
MKIISVLASLPLLIVLSGRAAPQAPGGEISGTNLKVVLLGASAGPTVNAQRLGISTLVLAGSEKLLFDCGRSVTTGMARLAVNPADVTKVFLTHLHSDHIVGFPELYLFPWASLGRDKPVQVWGPEGTRSMIHHLQEAFAFDIHVRRDVDERFPAEGIRVIATDIREGVVHEANGVKVTAFLVDHAPITPAFGYRVDYGGHSVVMSGDTRPSENLIKFSQHADVLIHEVGRWKTDPALAGPPGELFPGSRATRGQILTIANHHTDGVEAGRIFERVKPKLAVFSHFNVEPAATLALVRQNYAGSVEFGEDLMTIEIGDAINIRRVPQTTR